MSCFWIEGNQYDSDQVDIREQLQRHERGYFWAEHRDAQLEVHGVAEGGWWCEIREPRGTLPCDAVGSDAHGLVHTWDGGGEPFLLRRACALTEALAVAVLERFIRDGGRSDAVRWGYGLVRDSWGWGWRAAGTLEEYAEVEHLEELDDGGLHFSFLEPIPPSHTDSAVWAAITRLELGFAGGLEFLADHPIADLRALIVLAEDDPLAGLQAALDRHPALTDLTIAAAPAAGLTHLRAPALRRLHIVPDDADADADELTARFTALARQWDLPALERVAITDADSDEDDEDEDDDH